MPGSANRTALSKAVSMQSLQTDRQETQGVDQEIRFKQTQLLNLKQALDLNEEALREELYIDDKHREFQYQEKQRFDEVMSEINNKINAINEQLQGTVHQLQTQHTDQDLRRQA